MNKNTIIVLVTVVIVSVFGGTCIGLIGYDFWKFEQAQRGEKVVNPDRIEISYVDTVYEQSNFFEDRGECYLVVNVTNNHNFGWARVEVETNYTYRGEGTAHNSIYDLGINETRPVALTWGCPTVFTGDCKEAIYRNWEAVDIVGHKYEEDES